MSLCCVPRFLRILPFFLVIIVPVNKIVVLILKSAAFPQFADIGTGLQVVNLNKEWYSNTPIFVFVCEKECVKKTRCFYLIARSCTFLWTARDSQ